MIQMFLAEIQPALFAWKEKWLQFAAYCVLAMCLADTDSTVSYRLQVFVCVSKADLYH